MQIKKFFFYFHIRIHSIQKKYIPLHRYFKGGTTYEIQNSLFAGMARNDERLRHPLRLLNISTNVSVFQIVRKKAREKERLLLFNKHLKFYYND